MSEIDIPFVIVNSVLVIVTIALFIAMWVVKSNHLNGYAPMRNAIIGCLLGAVIVKGLIVLDDLQYVNRDWLWVRIVNEIGCVLVVWGFVRMFMLSMRGEPEQKKKDWGNFKKVK